MGKQQKVNVREWLDQCAPDEVRDVLIATLDGAADATKLLESVAPHHPQTAALREALAALSEPQA